MKSKITALILIAAILLTMLSGCGAAETEPETTTVPETVAPTTELTTEPTTEPTEPPTALEQFGVELWDGASNTWKTFDLTLDGVFMPISKGHCGVYNDYKTYFYIKEDAGRLLEELVAAPVDVQIYEFPASSFDADTHWIRDKLNHFYEYCKEQESSDISFTEWVNANRDKKLLWMQTTIKVDGTELVSKAIEEKFGLGSKGGTVHGSELVNPITGEWFCIASSYDYDKPMVGQWKMEVDGKEIDILVLYTRNYSDWHGEYYEKINAFWEIYVLLPAEFEDICFVMPEYASVEAYDGDEEEPETNALWETGNILEDYDTEKYNYYFYSLYSES